MKGIAPTVPFNDLGRHHEPLRDELRQAFERVVGSSGFILGEEVERFEQEFAAYCGAEYCVGVNSGTAALTLALLAAGVGRGDEVVVPAHTFVASALAVMHTGATPILCDVDEETGLIDLDAAAAAVTERTAAVLAVHLYGQCAPMAGARELALRYGLFVLEDAAQAHGATYKGERAGSLGTAGAFSFYPSKNLGALGDGGAICTSDAELARRARGLRDLGRSSNGEHHLPGFNERLDGVQAAVLRTKLPHVDRWNEDRRRHAASYVAALDRCVRTLAERPESPCIYHLFPIRTGDRERLAGDLARAGVATGVHYSPPVQLQPALEGTPSYQGSFPRAQAWADEELSLPIYPELEEDQVALVAGACKDSLSAR